MIWIKHLWTAIRVAWKWNQAADKGAKGQYEAAMQEILSAEKLAEKYLSPDFLLLKAVLAYQIGNPELAIQCVLDAQRRIRSYKTFSDAERKYLECYASALGLRIMYEQEYTGTHNFVVDYSSVDLAGVRGSTKKVFPLREHPAWQN